MNIPNNKRRKDSQEKIEKVFIQLIHRKNITDISVSTICEKAKLNRSTFYANYLDIYDLVEKVKKKMADDFAINMMIDNESWNQIINSNNIIETSKKISQEKNIPMSFIVRNLAYNRYIKYTDKFYNEYTEKVD